MSPVRGTLATAQTTARRAARVARGLADPATREPYAAELRSRFQRVDPADDGVEPGRHRCLICGSRRQTERKVSYTRDPSKSCRVRECASCGYVHMPGHVVSRYRAKTDIEQLPAGHPRLGTMEVPGREFHMAKMAVDILGGAGHDVLMYGAGRSMDNHHIDRLPQVRRVAVSDIMKVRDDAEFIDANDPPRRRFSVVIASEVIEHFRDPHEDFAKLFRLVKRNGLLVCGTNIYDGGRLEADR
jgi:ribosomal protein L32